MKEAPETVTLYMNKAIDKIDSALGKGYAKEHPELISAFITASASDFNNAAKIKFLEEKFGELICSIDSIRKQ
jgi:hypothetical protein